MSAHASHDSHAANFSDTELSAMHVDDYSAGKAVVLLMLGIFSCGVVLYSIVAYAVMS